MLWQLPIMPDNQLSKRYSLDIMLSCLPYVNLDWQIQKYLGGGKGFHSFAKNPTPDPKRREKLTRGYNPQPEVPGRWIENQGSFEVPKLVTREISQQNGRGILWHRPCQVHFRLQGKYPGRKEGRGWYGSDGGAPPLDSLGSLLDNTCCKCGHM